MKLFKKLIASFLICGMTWFTPLAYGAATKESDKLMEKGLMIPTGTIMPFAGSVAPAGWVLAYGQEVSQTSPTYAYLYAVIGSTYCTTDHGGTCTGGNFRLPDLRGRFLGGKDDMGGSAANRITTAVTIDGTVLGKAGGSQSQASNVALDAHSGTAVSAHSLSTNVGLSSHSGGAVSAHSLSTNVALSSHSGGAVNSHSLSTNVALSAHANGAVSAHSVTNNAVTSGGGSGHTHYSGTGSDTYQNGTLRALFDASTNRIYWAYDDGNTWSSGSARGYSGTNESNGSLTAGIIVAGQTGPDSGHTHGVTSNVSVGNHSFTQPDNHSITQPAINNHTFTQPGDHTITQPVVATHTFTQPGDHTITQPVVAAHSVTQPSAHTVTNNAVNNLSPTVILNYIIKL